MTFGKEQKIFLYLLFSLSLLVSFTFCEDEDEEYFWDDQAQERYLEGDTGVMGDELDSYPEKAGRKDEADVEVILNPGPMLAPDIIIGHFISSKVNVLDTIWEEKGLTTNNYANLSSLEGMAVNSSDNEPLISISLNISDLYMREDKMSVVDSFESDFDDIERFGSPLFPVEQRLYKNKKTSSSYCHETINATAGSFMMNFTEDCTVLLASPYRKSRLILECTPLKLGNCSTSRDSLTINLKGDMRFGRNSYYYCGPNAKIRAVSLRRKISMRARANPKIQGGVECSFHIREQRDLSTNKVIVDPEEICGRLGRNKKIVGGRRVSPGLFPWVAQLDITRTDGTQTACTGSLISPQFILTAAHCLKNAESISAFLGGTNRLEFSGSEVTIQADKYVLHRKWNQRSLLADIALVKLTDEVKYTTEISPICLPKPSGRFRREDMTGRKGVAVGWGRLETRTPAPRQLYRVRLPFLQDQSCRRVYRRYFQPKTMFCTDSTLETAICYGDSGGPLMYKKNGKVYQIGIASFSLSKTCGESPDVFTKVSEYSTWIKKRMQIEEDE